MSLRYTPTALEKCAIIGVCMLGFGIPWSSALFRLSFPIIFISLFWVGLLAIKKDESLRALFKEMMTEPFTWFIFLFVLWVIASGAWTIASAVYYKFDTSQYLKLLMIPGLAILIKIFLPDKGRFLLCLYLSGVLALTLPTALDALGFFSYFSIDTVQYRNAAYGDGRFVYFRNHIVHGFHVSALAAIVLLHSMIFKKGRVVACFALVYAFVDIMFWTSGRMALIGLFAGLIFSAWTSFIYLNGSQVRSVADNRWVYAFIFVLFSTIWLGMDVIYARHLSVVGEINQYLRSDAITSAGTRIHFWLVSINIFTDSWLIGSGSGAFRHTLEVTKDAYFESRYSHAHNEYLTILSQFGVVGFVLLLSVIYLLIKEALRHRDPLIGRSFLCLLVVFAINALTDSSLYNQWEGWALVYFSAVMIGSRSA